jgi:CheY-like chemotaxis protein
LGILADEIVCEADATPRELINDALSAARDGAELIHRLLAFSRKQPLQVKRLDINEFLRNVRRFLQRTLTENVELRINAGNDVPPVLVDPGQLENALLNLVINARDAMPGGGTLTIETTRERVARDEAASLPGLAPGDYVTIAVRDSGIGMSPEHMARAIEPFFTTKERGKGSGLGLSMVYGFAKQSGGDLLLRSTLGQGTTVSVLLPQAARTIEEDEAEPTPPNAPRGSETVLVVEDEPRVRKLVKRSLLGLGYRVIEAENAAEAMKVLEADVPVDLLFSDIVMPGDMNGCMLARWASHKSRGLKVLLTTAFSEEVNGELAMGKNGFPLLNKPYSKEELATAVRAVLDVEIVRRPNE